ncbi:hypothetical protein ACOSQ3_031786 [Xanthoceras sorbifolium]
MTLTDAKERIRRLEKIVGEPPSEDVPEVVVMIMKNLQQAVTEIWKDLEHMVDKLGLNLLKCSKRVKAVNLGAVAVLGETEIEEKLANSAERKYNKALDRGKCVATLEAKSGFVAESVGFVDELQLSIASNSGLVEFQRKLSDCSSIGMGPKQQMKHDDGSVTVG